MNNREVQQACKIFAELGQLATDSVIEEQVVVYNVYNDLNYSYV